MTRAYGLGPLPGTSIAEACDVIASETGALPHIPQLPDRGLGSDAVGRTASLLEAVHVDRGPRSWRMSPRPQLITRRTADRLERDLDECQATWDRTLPAVKIQLTGPWTLAGAIELADGHRVLTDSGALRDLTDAVIDGANRHTADVARRFGATDILVQLDEPWLADVVAGNLPGTTRLDEVRAVHPRDAGERLAHVVEGLDAGEVALNLTGQTPEWEVVRLSGVQTLQLTLDRITGTRQLDALGEAVSGGLRIGFGVTAAGEEIDERQEKPRTRAIDVARVWHELSLDPLLLREVDVHPKAALTGSLLDASRAYAMAQAVADILDRDAGNL